MSKTWKDGLKAKKFNKSLRDKREGRLRREHRSITPMQQLNVEREEAIKEWLDFEEEYREDLGDAN